MDGSAACDVMGEMPQPAPTPYAVAAGPVDAELEITRSRFLARLRPVTTRDEVHAALDAARAAHPAANHHCFAYQLGSPHSGEAAMSDDGEPSGTAGRPIFTVLRHQDVGDVLIVVTRYFGGVKLGAGGLVRAYMAAAQAVVAGMETVTAVPMVQVTLSAAFPDEQPVRHFCASQGGRVVEVGYGGDVDEAEVRLLIEVPTAELGDLESFCAARGIGIR